MKRKLGAILLVVALALSLGLVPAASVGASPGTIWTIGTIDGSYGEFGSNFVGDSATYDVGDALSGFPRGLYISGYSTPSHVNTGVHDVTINFSLDHWYYGVVLSYARLGSETDTVSVDGGPAQTLLGPGEGNVITHPVDIGVLAQGPHSIVITCVATGGADGWHYIDGLELTGSPLIIEKVLTDPALDPDTNDNGIGEVDMATLITFTMVITVTNQTGIDLTDVVAHDRLGAELELVDGLDATTGTASSYTKGKSAKVFIDWTIPSLANGASATLTIVAATDVNPGGGWKIHQEYTSPGIYDLNSGAAIVSVTIDDEVIEVDSQTPPIKVEAVGEDED